MITTSTMTEENLTKRRALVKCLESGGPVAVGCVTHLPGTVLPAALAQRETLKLVFNQHKGQHDIVTDDAGFQETLRFDGSWSLVRVPWDAVFFVAEEEARVERFACVAPLETEPVLRVLSGGDPDSLREDEVEALAETVSDPVLRRRGFRIIQGGKV